MCAKFQNISQISLVYVSPQRRTKQLQYNILMRNELISGLIMSNYSISLSDSPFWGLGSHCLSQPLDLVTQSTSDNSEILDFSLELLLVWNNVNWVVVWQGCPVVLQINYKIQFSL